MTDTPTVAGRYKIKPTPGKIVVKIMKAASMTQSGRLVLPDTVQEAPTQGRVIESYDAYTDIAGDRVEPLIKKGDIVVFGKYTGSRISIERNTFVIMRETDVLAVLQPLEANEPDQIELDDLRALNVTER